MFDRMTLSLIITSVIGIIFIIYGVWGAFFQLDSRRTRDMGRVCLTIGVLLLARLVLHVFNS
ncbi:MAG: hypothetical protein HFF84_04330 [Oscillibacter sp.]|nr:hypothetical protein [Oscillibacter sp.]